MSGPYCVKCGLSVNSEESTDHIGKSSCNHWYHWRCMYDLFTKSSMMNEKRQKLIHCTAATCAQLLNPGSFQQVTAPPNTPIPSVALEQPIFTQPINMSENDRLNATIGKLTMKIEYLQAELSSLQSRYADALKAIGNTSVISSQPSPGNPTTPVPKDTSINLPNRVTFHYNHPETIRNLETCRVPAQHRAQGQVHHSPNVNNFRNDHRCHNPCAQNRGINDPRLQQQPVLRNPNEDRPSYHRRYRHRFGTDSAELKPYYPLNSYPHFFTTAGFKMGPEEYVSAFFAFDILLMGDGHIYALARYLEDGKPHEGMLDRRLYARNLLLRNLVNYLASFDKLPPHLMISIGNFDDHCRTSYDEFYSQMNDLCLILLEQHVNELIIVPLLPHPADYQSSYEDIMRALNQNWGPAFGGVVIRVPIIFQELNEQTPEIDQHGPFFPPLSYIGVARSIKNRFIPEVQRGIEYPPTTTQANLTTTSTTTQTSPLIATTLATNNASTTSTLTSTSSSFTGVISTSVISSATTTTAVNSQTQSTLAPTQAENVTPGTSQSTTQTNESSVPGNLTSTTQVDQNVDQNENFNDESVTPPRTETPHNTSHNLIYVKSTARTPTYAELVKRRQIEAIKRAKSWMKILPKNKTIDLTKPSVRAKLTPNLKIPRVSPPVKTTPLKAKNKPKTLEKPTKVVADKQMLEKILAALHNSEEEEETGEEEKTVDEEETEYEDMSE